MDDAMKKIIRHYENCFKVHGNNHKGVDWPNKIDAEKRYSVMLQSIMWNGRPVENQRKIKILDYGCGLGHFLEFLKGTDNWGNIDYTGCDASEIMISECRQNYPQFAEKFFTSTIDASSITNEYDYIICNGVFTEKREYTNQEMWHFMQSIMRELSKKARYGIAFNVMSEHVDWIREDLYYLSQDKLTQFICQNISRKYIIRSDYGLYEYTIYVYF